MQGQLRVGITIGVGGVHGGRETLRRSTTRLPKRWPTRSCVAAASSSTSTISRKRAGPPTTTRSTPKLRLINNIKDGDAEQCGRILEDKIFTKTSRGATFRPTCCAAVLRRAEHGPQDTRRHADALRRRLSGGGTEPVDLLLQAETTEEFYANVRSVVQDICWHVRQHRDRPKDRLKRAILDDILDRHFTDSTLTQTSVAESIRHQPAVPVALFKREIKVNMMDYIHRLRIDHARRLIAETDPFAREHFEAIRLCKRPDVQPNVQDVREHHAGPVPFDRQGQPEGR